MIMETTGRAITHVTLREARFVAGTLPVAIAAWHTDGFVVRLPLPADLPNRPTPAAMRSTQPKRDGDTMAKRLPEARKYRSGI